MQLLPSLILLSSAAALPSGLTVRGPGPACVHPPYTYGCGTSLQPRCCTKEEYEKLHPSSTSTSTVSQPTGLITRGPGPACVVAPYLYGCGTSLKPRCCTKEEYDAMHSSTSTAAASTAAASTAAASASATNDLYNRGVGPACVIPPYTCGCGTALAPRCCTEADCEAAQLENHIDLRDDEDNDEDDNGSDDFPAAATTAAESATATSPGAATTTTPVIHWGPGPACVIPPYTYGCGTGIAPRCCTKEEYDAIHGSDSS